MHNRFYIALFLVMVFFVVSCAKGKPGSVEDRQLGSGPYFWKVEKGGKTSYFFGTVHVGVELDRLQCSKEIRAYLENSDYFFTETDVQSEDTQKFAEIAQAALASMIVSKDSRKFDALNDESKIFFNGRDIPKHFNYIGYMVIVNDLCTQKASYEFGGGALSLDSQLKAIAQVKNIPIEHLDTDMSEDVDTIAGVLSLKVPSLDVKKTDVEKAVLNFNTCVSNNVNFFHKYIAGDLDSKARNFNDRQKQIILKDRNQKWIKKFKSARGKYSRIFLAGGAGHFIFDFNLLDTLKADGFSITRMNASCQF